jgi:tetratricopeptide (TPR) repeat protein
VTRTGAPDDAATATYTLRRVQALLGLSRSVVAGLIAEGFVSPARGKRGEWRFGFQDLMLLRTAHALQQAGIAPRRILRSLAKLKAELPAELPLTGLRISAIGADVAVRSPQGQWQAASGQLLMDFDVVAPAAGSVAILDRGDDAQAWFERGVALERTDTAGAQAAYAKALALAPGHEAAALNLGALWAEAGRHAELLALCERALMHTPGSALLHFNRAVALDHLERLPDAAAAYEQALALDAQLADAHYNLGRLREQLGDARGALRHFSAYRRLQRG